MAMEGPRGASWGGEFNYGARILHGICNSTAGVEVALVWVDLGLVERRRAEQRRGKGEKAAQERVS